MPIISMENVCHYYYRGTPLQSAALTEFSLEVEKGEFIALVGHTGSGKSTVLQHLNGLLLPHRGRVLIAGEDTRNKTVRKRLWSRVGLVLQYPERQFFEETVFREVSFGPRNLGLGEGEVKDRVLKAMDMVGIKVETEKVSPFGLSGGEQRRLALASVLAVNPEILALDEPTAGIDAGGRKRIYGALTRLKKECGATILMASHSMEDMSLLADRVVVLDEGSILMSGGTRQIFSNPGVIEKAGLELPFAWEITRRLKEEGFDIEGAALTIDEAVDGILKNMTC